MPRKKVVPSEEIEQANGLEMEGIPTEAMDGLEQPPGDVPQEEAVLAEDAPSPETGTPPIEEQPEPAPPEPPTEPPPKEPEEASAMKPFWMEPEAPPPEPVSPPPRNDRREFFSLDFNALDRGLTAEERQE